MTNTPEGTKISLVGADRVLVNDVGVYHISLGVRYQFDDGKGSILLVDDKEALYTYILYNYSSKVEGAASVMVHLQKPTSFRLKPTASGRIVCGSGGLPSVFMSIVKLN